MGVQATLRGANCDIVINMVAESRTSEIRGSLCLFLKETEYEHFKVGQLKCFEQLDHYFSLS